MKFKVLTAASMKLTAFWDRPPYIVVQGDRYFKRGYFLYQQIDM
jgi:hypothetical protein